MSSSRSSLPCCSAILQAKRKTHENVINHKTSVWQLENHEKALQAADAFLATFRTVSSRDTAERFLNDLRGFQRRSMDKFRIDPSQALA